MVPTRSSPPASSRPVLMPASTASWTWSGVSSSCTPSERYDRTARWSPLVIPRARARASSSVASSATAAATTARSAPSIWPTPGRTRKGRHRSGVSSHTRRRGGHLRHRRCQEWGVRSRPVRPGGWRCRGLRHGSRHRLGRVDLLAANAGIYDWSSAPPWETSDEAWYDQIGLRFEGVAQRQCPSCPS